MTVSTFTVSTFTRLSIEINLHRIVTYPQIKLIVDILQLSKAMTGGVVSFTQKCPVERNKRDEEGNDNDTDMSDENWTRQEV